MAGVNSLGKLTLDMVAKTGGFTGPIDKAARHSKAKSKEIESSWKNVGMAVGVAAAAAATAIGVMVKQSIDAADNARKTAQAVGVTTEALTGLQWAASQSGVSNEQLASALTRLNASIGDAARGTKLQKEAFQSLGISIRDANGEVKSADKVLGEIADRFSEAADGVGKTDAAVKLFGRSGAALIPLLNSGSTGIKELTDQAKALGLVISDEQARQSEQFNDSLATLGAVSRGAANQIAREMLPALNEMTGLLIELATDSETATVAAELLGGTMKVLATGVILAVEGLEKLVALVKVIKSAGLKDMGDLQWDETFQTFVPTEAKAQASKSAWADYMDQHAKITEKTMARINKLWSGGYSGAAEGANKVRKALSVAGDENGKLSDSASKADDAIRKQIEALEFQAATLGMAADKITLLKLAKEGATDAQLAAAAAALKTAAVYKELDTAAQSFVEQQREINREAQAISDSMMTDEEGINAAYERRREIILRNTAITGNARGELLRRLEEQYNEDLLALSDDYWTTYMSRLEEHVLDMDPMIGGMLDDLSSRFGSFFESAVFDSENLGDSFHKMVEGMARSMVNALGQMAAQWLVYHAVRSAADKTAQSSAAATMTANAEAASLQAGINAYSSAAAIPYTGWIVAPGAMAAAQAATQPLVGMIAALASSAVGMAHDGIESVPQTGTWLLQRGERVVTESTSKKLDRTLDSVRRDDNRQTPPAVVTTRVVNVLDPSVVGDYMATPDGERVVLNIMRRNRRALNF